MTTPMLDRVLSHENPASLLGYLLMRERTQLVDELRALLAERDELQAKVDAQIAPRRLRSYKGVTYRDAAWYTPDGKRYEMASGVVWNKSVTLSLTDLDIPALLALRGDSYQPVETFEDVVEDWYWGTPMVSVAKSDRENLCARLRAWLAQQTHDEGLAAIGAKNAQFFRRSDELTAAECVARLVELGAREEIINVARFDLSKPEFQRCLILPPEVSK